MKRASRNSKMKGSAESDRYRATRDRELWYVKLEGGKIQACFYAQGGLFKAQRVMYCLPAVHGDKILTGVLEQALIPLVVHETTEGWMCDEEKLRLLGVKAPGITPSWYNRRPGLQARYADPETCDINPKNAKFIRRAAQRAGLPDPHLMKTMFGWMQQQMIEDLIVHHEPIDLGFAWLIAVPYRPNWKDALAHNADYNLDTLKETRATVFRRLTSLTLAGVRGVGKNEQSEKVPLYGFHWVLEVIPKPMWHRAAAEVELETRKQGGEAHLRNWARIIWELRPRLQQALEEYALACKLPVGHVSKSDSAKNVSLLPYAGSELLQKNGSDSPDPIVWGDGSPPVWTPEGEALPTGGIKRKYEGIESPLDIGMPRTKNLITIKPVAPSVLDGFPSGDATRPKTVPEVEPDAVPVSDPVPAPESGGTAPVLEDADPYPWADDGAEAPRE